MTKIQKQRLAFYRLAMSASFALIIGAFIFQTPYMEASGIVDYCERQHKFNTFSKHTPYTIKKCSLIFEKKTFDWMTGNY